MEVEAVFLAEPGAAERAFHRRDVGVARSATVFRLARLHQTSPRPGATAIARR